MSCLWLQTLRTAFAMQRSVASLTCAFEALVLGPALLAPLHHPPNSDDDSTPRGASTLKHRRHRHCSERLTWWAAVGLLMGLGSGLVKVANAVRTPEAAYHAAFKREVARSG